MIKKANIQWSAKALSKSIASGKVSFDNAVQRGYVWDVSRKSLLIHSMSAGFPIPAFYAAKTEAGYDMLDGKQRSEAISSFLSDGYKLSNCPDFEYETDMGIQVSDFNDFTFSQLPEELQDTIKDYSLTVYYFDGITDEEIADMFLRLNNGKPLTAIELTRVSVKSKEVTQRISEHPVFSSACTKAALAKYAHEEIVLKLYMSLYTQMPAFSAKAVKACMSSCDITDEQEQEILSLLSKYNEAISLLDTKDKQQKSAKKEALKRNNMISCIVAIREHSNVSSVILADWLCNGTPWVTSDVEYAEASKQGSATCEAVDTRHILATTSLEEYTNKQ